MTTAMSTGLIPFYRSATDFRVASSMTVDDCCGDIKRQVAAILDRVRQEGDKALRQFTCQFNGVDRPILRVVEAEITAALQNVTGEMEEILQEAIGNIRRFHQRQRPQSWQVEDDSGTRLAQRVRPIRRVGIYAPGGTASYPSSVMMNAIPAQVAGVPEIVLISPPVAETGSVRSEILVVAHLLGISEIYVVGGVQGIAALAYGTESIPRVDKIIGPGNRYVTEAKRQVFGRVGIDALAGPSEIVVVADESANIDFVIADLLSQAEHDTWARAILISPSAELLHQVQGRVESFICRLPRAEIIRRSLAKHGALVWVQSLDEAVDLVNHIAPEHLVLLVTDPEEKAELIHSAGAIFLGPFSPPPVGDYWLGPNHVLPTSGAAPFSSALSVADFVTTSSVIHCTAERLRRDGQKIMALARLEQLDAHAEAIAVRLDKKPDGTGEVKEKDTNFYLGMIKPEVRRAQVYHLHQGSYPIKLNQNENPWDVDPVQKKQILQACQTLSWNRYPSLTHESLRAQVAEYLQVEPENVLLGNGCNQLLVTTMMATLGKGDPILLVEPSFTLYRHFAQILQAQIITLSLLDDFSFPVTELKEAVVTHFVPLTILGSPNNPTGSIIGRAALESLLTATSGLILLDEAYVEFAPGSLIDLIREFPNLVVARTFSKAFALAGVRFGCLVGAAELIAEIAKVAVPYSLDSLSAVIVGQVLVQKEAVQERVALICQQRQRLYDAINRLPGWQAWPSTANFLLFAGPLPAQLLFDKLKARGILVRDVSHYPMLQDKLRVSVGTPSENTAFLRALHQISEECTHASSP